MSWKKKYRKAKASVKGVVKKVGTVAKGLMGSDPLMGNFLSKSDSGGDGDSGLRSAAATRLRKTTQQAGGGQISFMTEDEV